VRDALNESSRAFVPPPLPTPSESDHIDKRTVCVEILSSGFVQSFVDFFYLTHRPNPTPDLSKDNNERDEITVTPDNMMLMQRHLVEAEAARRRAGQIQVVYSSYNALARHFQEQNDHRTGIYFYEKCLEIANMTVDPVGEMKANHNLGLAYEGTDDYEQAIQFHERHLELAEVDENQEEQQMSNEQLMRTYHKQAEKMETLGNLQEVALCHQKCLKAAQRVGDHAEEGKAHYRLGRVHIELGTAKAGMEHLQAYLKIAQELNDLEGQGAAYSAIAAAYQALDNSDAAVDALQQFLKFAEQTDNLEAQADACCNLGLIYNEKGLFDRAVEYFAQNYSIVRNIVSKNGGSLKLVDKARVNLGMAKGNLTFGSYMHVINNDIKALLKWKNSRVEIMHEGGA